MVEIISKDPLLPCCCIKGSSKIEAVSPKTSTIKSRRMSRLDNSSAFKRAWTNKPTGKQDQAGICQAGLDMTVKTWNGRLPARLYNDNKNCLQFLANTKIRGTSTFKSLRYGSPAPRSVCRDDGRIFLTPKMLKPYSSEVLLEEGETCCVGCSNEIWVLDTLSRQLLSNDRGTTKEDTNMFTLMFFPILFEDSAPIGPAKELSAGTRKFLHLG